MVIQTLLFQTISRQPDEVETALVDFPCSEAIARRIGIKSAICRRKYLRIISAHSRLGRAWLDGLKPLISKGLGQAYNFLEICS